jgi:hypothetical protein
MITAETVNGIVRFQASGLPVVSLYCRVDPGESQREMDELAAAVIGTGGSARQIAADLMSEEHLAAAKLRFRRPPPDQGS